MKSPLRIAPEETQTVQPQALLVDADQVRPMRDLHRREMNCQIIHDSWLDRRWVDAYALQLDGNVVGYGLVGDIRGERKTIVTEYFVLPEHRGAALPLFRALIESSGADRFDVQTNDLLFTLMVYDCGVDIQSDTVLFNDALTTNLSIPGATFRKFAPQDAGRVLGRERDEPNEWLIEANGEIVAAGGLLYHYNPPYGDIYMEVAPSQRRRGYGSYLVQELKRTAYELGKIPAARCNVANVGSRSTLQKAGMLPCARILTGSLAR
jgi:GNAT superfamily N-acetyltransferase